MVEIFSVIRKLKIGQQLRFSKSTFKISLKTLIEVLAGIWVNLTSGWFGAFLVAPGFFGVTSAQEYSQLLITNLPSGIFGLCIALFLTERSKRL